MYKVNITLKSDLPKDELNKVMEQMLWDSEYSYQFQDANWKIK